MRNLGIIVLVLYSFLVIRKRQAIKRSRGNHPTAKKR